MLKQMFLLVDDDHMRLKEHFHWVVPQTVVTQVTGQILHCEMIKENSSLRGHVLTGNEC